MLKSNMTNDIETLKGTIIQKDEEILELNNIQNQYKIEENKQIEIYKNQYTELEEKLKDNEKQLASI